MSEPDDRLTMSRAFPPRVSRSDNVVGVEVSCCLMPGAALLIEHRGETVMKRALGYRNRAAGTAMTTDTARGHGEKRGRKAED